MRLLLVEDYAPLRESIAKGLRDSGFAVDVAEDGEEGLWYANGHEYDALILDIMLPKLDGLSLLKKLRTQQSQTHVLLLTARDSVEDRINGLNAGADDYLVKPFVFEELLARINALLRRKYQQKSTTIEANGLTINTATQTVQFKNNNIQLSAREYALLHFLVLRKGEIVSRAEIWDHLYEFHSSTSSNVVDVYISFLRRKLSPLTPVRLIRTHRGRGYSFGIGSEE